MSQNWMTVAAGVVAGSALLASGQGGLSDRPAPSAAVTSEAIVSTSRAAAEVERAELHPPGSESWKEPLRLYSEFFGILANPDRSALVRVRGKVAKEKVRLDISTTAESASSDLDMIEKGVKAQAYHLEFLIALVADPIDSRLASDFDLSMSAIQQAMADSGYELDRQWLPWVESDAAEEKEFRRTPGVLLFRSDRPMKPAPPAQSDPRDRRLAMVLLVGETPKFGIHKEAFRKASGLILDISRRGLTRAVGRVPEIPILGPYFSGSGESLRLAMGQVPDAYFHVVSGSATSEKLPGKLRSGLLQSRVRFFRTVTPDFATIRTATNIFTERLGWDPGHLGLLVEADTTFGAEATEGLSAKIKLLRFPSSLVALRNAWEESGFAPAPDAMGHLKGQPVARTTLEVSLKDPQTPVDVVPHLSPLTVRIEDMASTDLLQQLVSEKIDYLGILATDVKDEIFLAEKIRRWAPNVTLFSLDSNMLYVHPQYNATLSGVLTVSGFPLITEGIDEETSPGMTGGRLRRHFASAWHEGVYLAALELLGIPAPEPKVWIGASGNLRMAPLAVRAATDEKRPEASTEAISVGPKACGSCALALGTEKPEDRPDLKLFVLAVALCLAALWVTKHRRVVEMTSKDNSRSSRPALSFVTAWILVRRRPRFYAFSRSFAWVIERRPEPLALMKKLPSVLVLVTIAQSILCTAAAGLACLRFESFLAKRPSSAPVNAWLSLILLWLLFLVFLGLLARSTSGCLRLRDGEPLSRWLALASAVFAAFSPLLFWVIARGIAAPGDVLFAARLTSFANGLSPVVPFGLLAVAGFSWVAVELRRRIEWGRHRITWPIPEGREATFVGCTNRMEQIEAALDHSFPRDRPTWLTIGLVLLPPNLLLWGRVQPVADPQSLGRLFLIGMAAASTLSLISLTRFLF